MPNEHGYAYKEVGRRIRELRGRDRQKDWAKEIGCDQGYISQVENGVTKPSLAFLRSVAALKNARSIGCLLAGSRPRATQRKRLPSNLATPITRRSPKSSRATKSCLRNSGTTSWSWRPEPWKRKGRGEGSVTRASKLISHNQKIMTFLSLNF